MSSRIVVKQHTVFSGRGPLKLACSPIVRQVPNGDLLCYWLTGSDAEPAYDNCVVMSRSTDAGRTWSDPDVLLPAGDMATSLTSMHATTDRRLIAFWAQWPHEKGYTEWHYFRMESRDSGHTWSESCPLVLHDNHITLLSPLQLANGEYLFPACFYDRRPKPLVAPVTELCDASSEEEALAMPAVQGQVRGGKCSTHLIGCSVVIASDENATDLNEHGYIANRPLGLLEPTCVQLRDGRVVMFMRAEFGGFLWRAESSDNSRTWTPAWETDIPDPSSLPFVLRLADGRIALIHNAAGTKGTWGPRNPLSIWVSDDELESWAIREDVIATSGNYRPDDWADGPDKLAYPSGLVLEDRFVFVYDRNRREVMFVEVEFAD